MKRKKINVLMFAFIGAVIGLIFGLIESFGIISGIIPRHYIGGIFLYLSGWNLILILFLRTIMKIIIGTLIGGIFGAVIWIIKIKK